MDDPLADFLGERMICKHFNVSYVQVREDIDLYEYWQMLAVAYDAEELDDYNMATLVAIGVNNPKQIRKWKFATSDKAGTTPQGINPAQSLIGIAMALSGGDVRPSGSAVEFARATGRRIIYIIAPDTYVDEAGDLTERTRNDMVLPKPQTVQ